MAQYTVRAGDTLLSIAEQCYGHGHLWQLLAESNPLARAGVLYEGQRLELPPLSPLPSLADSRRLAQPLGHMPVRIKLDGSGPQFRFDGFGALAIAGLVGELILHRHGSLHLGELTPARLLGYRLEQVAWARELFLMQFCNPNLALQDFEPNSTGPCVPREAVHRCGPGYTITGHLGQWRVVNLQPNVALRRGEWRCSLALQTAALFQGATLALDDDAIPPEAAHERLLPLGRVLRAACPHLITPANLWVLTRDRSSFPQSQVSTYSPAQGNGSVGSVDQSATVEDAADDRPIKQSRRKLLARRARATKRTARRKTG
jgi:hypothetical protein